MDNRSSVPNPSNRLPLRLPHELMDLAQAAGRTRQLGPTYWQITRYQGCWWIHYENGWLRVTDQAIIDELNGKTMELWAAVYRDTERLTSSEGVVVRRLG